MATLFVIILLILKCTKTMKISWWWVFSPYIALGMLFMLFGICVYMIGKVPMDLLTF